MQNVKELTSYIKSDTVRRLVESIIEAYCPMFIPTMKKAASSTGKYHPMVSNIEFGLMHHTIMAMKAAKRLTDLYKPAKIINDLQIDIIMAAAILHDAWKYNALTAATKSDKESGTVFIFEAGKVDLAYLMPKVRSEHGYIGYLFIKRFMEELDEDMDTKANQYILSKIATAVRYHMSNWCHNSSETEAAQTTKSLINRIVQEADMIVSERGLMDYAG